MGDYYGELGCCLTCDDEDKQRVNGWNGIDGEGCLCYSCKCSKCSHLYHGKCDVAGTWWTWEDYENQAIKIKEETENKFGKEPNYLKATFSNGTIEHTVYYVYACDIPHKIKHHLKIGYPYNYRTLLLKKVEEVLL